MTSLEDISNRLSAISLKESKWRCDVYKMRDSYKLTFQSSGNEKAVHVFGAFNKGNYNKYNGKEYCTFNIFSKSDIYTITLPLLRLEDKDKEEKQFVKMWDQYLKASFINGQLAQLGIKVVEKVSCLEL